MKEVERVVRRLVAAAEGAGDRLESQRGGHIAGREPGRV
jgi:hypothetical protein